MLQDPTYAPLPSYWVAEQEVNDRLSRAGWNRDWLIGWRDVTDATNSTRTLVSTVFPHAAVSGKFPLLLPKCGAFVGLVANLSTFVLDYASRQKIGGKSLSMFMICQLPVLPPAAYTQKTPWIQPSLSKIFSFHEFLELTYTAWDLQPFAQDCGWEGPPFRWHDERRFLLRCELDAAFLHLYMPTGTSGEWCRSKDESGGGLQAMEATFPSPEARRPTCSTRSPLSREETSRSGATTAHERVVLEIFDAMAKAARAGEEYVTRLDPPPADPRCCHPRKEFGILAFGSLINEPGPELNARIVMRIKTQTPFPVEYGRYSGRTRGGAPTLVPHTKGAPVRAEILVLDDDVSVARGARNLGGANGAGSGAARHTSRVRRQIVSSCAPTNLLGSKLCSTPISTAAERLRNPRLKTSPSMPFRAFSPPLRAKTVSVI